MKTSFSLKDIKNIRKYRLSIAAVLIILLSLVVVNMFWLDPVVAVKESVETKVHQQEDMIRKYEQKLTQAQAIRANLEKQEQDLREMQRRLFRGTDPYQLAGSLGDLLSGKGAGEKLDIKTYQVLASKEYGLYQEVHLRFNFMTTVDGLFVFLDRVKNSEFAILVQEINIQKIQRVRGPDLVINVILAALMDKPEKGEGSAPAAPAKTPAPPAKTPAPPAKAAPRPTAG